MSKCDSNVRSGLEFKSAQLAWMDEVIGRNSELNSFSNHFFNELSESVEKYIITDSIHTVKRIFDLSSYSF